MTDRIHYDCFIRSCGRPRLAVTDLCCPEHWKLVPKRLKQPLIEAGKLRSFVKRQRASEVAASYIVEYLMALKIQLPPAVKLDTSGTIVKHDSAPGSLIQAESSPKLEEHPKLIITDRR